METTLTQQIRRVLDIHSVDAYLEADICFACDQYTSNEPGFTWDRKPSVKEQYDFLGY